MRDGGKAARACAASRRMSSCLICQRPDICSTTSLESIRTSTAASGSSSAAAVRPASRPRYSATLLVAVPMASATSAGVADLLVEGEELAGDAGGGVGTRVLLGRRLGVQAGQRLVPSPFDGGKLGVDLGCPRLMLAEPGFGRLQPLHDLQLGVLEDALPLPQ